MINTIVKVERNCPFCQGDSFFLTPYGNSEWPIVRCRKCKFVYLRLLPDYIKVERNCPFCQEDSFVLTPHGHSEWPIVRCLKCKFIYLRFVPDYATLTEESAWEKTSELKTVKTLPDGSFKNRLARRAEALGKNLFPSRTLGHLVQKYVPRGNVLDIGCADGNFLCSLKGGYVPYGIEISNTLAVKAAERLASGAVINDSALSGLSQLPADFFDGVIMSAFLEHEPAPVQVLKKTRRVLKAGGVLIIKVANYGSLFRLIRAEKWCGFRLPEHVNYFTPKTLTGCCRQSGLEVIGSSWAGFWFIKDNMWMVVKK